MSEAKYVSTTHNQRAVRYIEADLDAIKIEGIKGKSVRDSGKYGVNGTFFYGTKLTGIAVNRNANGKSEPVLEGGGSTSGVNYNGKVIPSKRGTMYYFNPPAGRIIFDDKPVRDYLDYPNSSTSNVVWAIGGYSLFPVKNYKSSDEYYSDINGKGSTTKQPTENSENAYRFEPTNRTARTAIGFKHTNSKSKIILAVFESETAWEVRSFMKGLYCTSAIMLDGGGSSQMRYKTSRGTTEFWCPKPDRNNKIREVHSMVTVNASKWV
ncbi:phosphodiester glycosidase family protein [Paenibacillus thiaminolyticus]|uniref:phosphodiester glycosidase family protein n=1 Tax=Paenibacillus thiaminolyticus TaxID=49283 RepID=UPI0035A5C71D